MDTKLTRGWLLPLLALAILLTGWTAWLRAPSIGAPMWNVDETIHAAAARRILEGGLMYRDVIDQRTPLTYYVFAAIFRVAGVNNLPAVRIVLCGMIAATALGLFVLGRRIHRTTTGVWAAVIFTAIANFLIYPGDAFAAHTEWFVILFTTAGALVFLWPATCPSFRRSLLVGAIYALAFLSKQTALVDALVPVATLAWLAIVRSWSRSAVLRAGLGMAVGFLAVSGAVVLVFVLLGGGRDLLFYTWTYNLRYYGPEIEWPQRLVSCRWFLGLLLQYYPVAFVSGLLGLLFLAVRALQLAPKPAWSASRASDFFLLTWCGTSLFGAIASGRGFDHYFIQCMPPFAWLAAWLPGWITRRLWPVAGRLPSGIALSSLSAIALFALAINVAWTPLAARKQAWFGADPSERIDQFMREHSRPDEKIFVWGYNPDIYLYTNRSPASRYLYCTFQTGLIPWTNLAPDKDTQYAVVPGAMDSLLADLSASRPKFIVDCGTGPHRHFEKYPLEKFEKLRQLVERDYVEIDPAQYQPLGFRLFMARDRSASPSNLELGADRHPAPFVSASLTLSVGANSILVGIEESSAKIQRIALLVDGAEFAAIRCATNRWLKFLVSVPLTEAGKRHRLEAVAEWTDGTRTVSKPVEAEVAEFGATAAQRTEFEIPRVKGAVPAEGVRALLNPKAEWSQGVHSFALHAPSMIRYKLPAGSVALRGRYGLPPGAYAPENKAPSDGARFIIRAVSPLGISRVLLDRLLQPAREPGDRPEQSFRVSLEGAAAGSLLELEITPGPGEDRSSDWTFWSDVELETSP